MRAGICDPEPTEEYFDHDRSVVARISEVKHEMFAGTYIASVLMHLSDGGFEAVRLSEWRRRFKDGRYELLDRNYRW